jgi:hypothetical protein
MTAPCPNGAARHEEAKEEDKQLHSSSYWHDKEASGYTQAPAVSVHKEAPVSTAQVRSVLESDWMLWSTENTVVCSK